LMENKHNFQLEIDQVDHYYLKMMKNFHLQHLVLEYENYMLFK
jgi:hypothetical protein